MRLRSFRQPRVERAEGGVTIIELAIVITVLLIILAITVPGYRHVVRLANEDVLREDLRVMRKMIDQFTADRERAPRSLEELVEHRYLPEIPVDPMTGSSQTWEVILEDEPVSRDGERGIQDIRSGSHEVDSSGQRRYSEW